MELVFVFLLLQVLKAEYRLQNTCQTVKHDAESIE